MLYKEIPITLSVFRQNNFCRYTYRSPEKSIACIIMLGAMLSLLLGEIAVEKWVPVSRENPKNNGLPFY